MSAKESKKATDNGRATNWQGAIQREVLPIPDRKPVGLTTYDAKDPDTKFFLRLRPYVLPQVRRMY